MMDLGMIDALKAVNVRRAIFLNPGAGKSNRAIVMFLSLSRFDRHRKGLSCDASF